MKPKRLEKEEIDDDKTWKGKKAIYNPDKELIHRRVTSFLASDYEKLKEEANEAGITFPRLLQNMVKIYFNHRKEYFDDLIKKEKEAVEEYQHRKD